MLTVPPILFSRKMFKLVFVLYKLKKKGVEPGDVQKMLLDSDKAIEEHFSLGTGTDGNYDSCAGS
jgi:hypothetical protein